MPPEQTFILECYREAKVIFSCETGQGSAEILLSRNTLAKLNKVSRFAKT